MKNIVLENLACTIQIIDLFIEEYRKVSDTTGYLSFKERFGYPSLKIAFYFYFSEIQSAPRNTLVHFPKNLV